MIKIHRVSHSFIGFLKVRHRFITYLCLTFVLFLFLNQYTYSQELNFNVEIQLSPSLPTADNSIYEDMESNIRQFLNNTKWTEDNFNENELIECNLVILINERPSVNSFAADGNIQLARPIYGSSYNSILLNLSQNYADNNFDFDYVTSQPLNYVENAYQNELTAILTFYVYTLIGLDYDSFSLLGGTAFHDKARQIVFQADRNNTPGWTQNQIPPRNRYWLNENLTSKQLQPVREAIYEYHRQGLDLMHKDAKTARINILKALRKIKKVYEIRNNSFIIILFIHTKTDELVKIFSEGDISIRRQVYNLLVQMQPNKQSEFINIIK